MQIDNPLVSASVYKTFVLESRQPVKPLKLYHPMWELIEPLVCVAVICLFQHIDSRIPYLRGAIREWDMNVPYPSNVWPKSLIFLNSSSKHC